MWDKPLPAREGRQGIRWKTPVEEAVDERE